ncbi:MAG: AcrR family transcriptional regulator, partial [Glaciecola sp.]
MIAPAAVGGQDKDPSVASSATPDRILDATLELLACVGVAALSLEDVAQTAGVSRQTVYRHFGNRDQLFAATVLREEQVFIDRLMLVTMDHVDLRSALEAAIRETLLAARQHPLLDRLLETEPEALLPFLTSGS